MKVNPELQPYKPTQLARKLRRLTRSDYPSDRAVQLWYATGVVPGWVAPMLRQEALLHELLPVVAGERPISKHVRLEPEGLVARICEHIQGGDSGRVLQRD